jgi:hypothetical protein
MLFLFGSMHEMGFMVAFTLTAFAGVFRIAFSKSFKNTGGPRYSRGLCSDKVPQMPKP